MRQFLLFLLLILSYSLADLNATVVGTYTYKNKNNANGLSISKIVLRKIDDPYIERTQLENKGFFGENQLHSAVATSSSISTDDVSLGLDSVSQILDQFIVVGKKVWTIVESNRPIVNQSFTPSFSILPKELMNDLSSAFYLMENWSLPKSEIYEVAYTNLLGIDVVKFRYAVIMNYGGSYNGKGNYLTGVKVVPVDIDCVWGYSLDATSELVSTINLGSNDFPIVGVTLRIGHRVKTAFKDEEINHVFSISGRGEIKLIAQ